MSRIITVGREFGSGGRELGRRLAEELGIQYYDREIISKIAENADMAEDYVHEMVEGRSMQLFPITIAQSFGIAPDYRLMQMQDLLKAQTEIMIELAEKGDCIIIGRCADYILRDYKPNRLFVYADLDSRVARCMSKSGAGENMTEQQMRKKIIGIDRNRAKYYNDFTGQKWGDKRYYDLCINTTGVVIKDIVPVLARLF